LEEGFRLDMLVEDSLVLELKAVDEILPVHLAQILTYLKLSNRRLGLLINFNVTRIKDGIKRVALKRFTTEAQRTQRFTENK
jgi:GxxExxY protein